MRNFLLYTGVGITVALAAILLGVHQARSGHRAEDSLKWVGFAVLTLLVFWWIAQEHRDLWTGKQFWRFFGAFAMIHAGVGISILVSVRVTSLLPFILATPLEMWLVSACLNRVLSQGSETQN